MRDNGGWGMEDGGSLGVGDDPKPRQDSQYDDLARSLLKAKQRWTQRPTPRPRA